MKGYKDMAKLMNTKQNIVRIADSWNAFINVRPFTKGGNHVFVNRDKTRRLT